MSRVSLMEYVGLSTSMEMCMKGNSHMIIMLMDGANWYIVMDNNLLAGEMLAGSDMEMLCLLIKMEL